MDKEQKRSMYYSRSLSLPKYYYELSDESAFKITTTISYTWAKNDINT